jgi:hypothetical protein
MSNRRTDGVRGVALPTLACSLVCGASVVVMALAAVVGLEGSRAHAAPVPALLPPARVAVAPPPAPLVPTDAPTATDWVVQLPSPGR